VDHIFYAPGAPKDDDKRMAALLSCPATSPFMRVSKRLETPISVSAIMNFPPGPKTGAENAVHVGFRIPVVRAI
jgi:hypothetical protein